MFLLQYIFFEKEYLLIFNLYSLANVLYFFVMYKQQHYDIELLLYCCVVVLLTINIIIDPTTILSIQYYLRYLNHNLEFTFYFEISEFVFHLRLG